MATRKPAKRRTPRPDPNGHPPPSDSLRADDVLRIAALAGIRLEDASVRPLLEGLRRLRARPSLRELGVPSDTRQSLVALREEVKRFHGAKVALAWFPPFLLSPVCGDRFGYLSSAATRSATKLAFNVANQALLGQLGAMMGDAGNDLAPDSALPAGFTYFGQFVDHDITLDVTSTLDAATNATAVPNMRSPKLDLDSLYGAGPALEPYLYQFPTGPFPTAVRFQLGTNTPNGPGGPGGIGGGGAMIPQVDYDVPRVAGTQTAIIGDPRNDENLIVSQLHQTMLRFHNKVVDLFELAGVPGDIFDQARTVVTHHYQWAVVNDYLRRVCGDAAVDDALASVAAPIGSAFRMPVEFAVAAYRFGHSQIRNSYWINHVHIGMSLADVFASSRVPNLPVLSDRVVDFNAFFDTGIFVPVDNKARRIDSALANGLEFLPGFTGMMAELATRNLRRGLALGLPSGQGMAAQFGIAPMTAAQLTSGLPPAEVAVLGLFGNRLLDRTPLWYYVLREAAVLEGGERLGPVGGKIVADTFIRMLRRDAGSYLNAGSFAPILPSDVAGDFTVADLIKFAGVHEP